MVTKIQRLRPAPSVTVLARSPHAYDASGCRRGARRNWSLGACASLILLAASVAGGCGAERHSEYFGTTRPRHGPNELWINNGSEPEWIDPNRCSDGAGSDVIRNIFVGLLSAHPETLEPIYEIAHSYEANDDRTEFVFHLRPTRWSDGRPLTAHDFEWSWKRLLNPATAAKYNMMGFVLENGELYNRSAVVVGGIPVEVLDQPDATERLRALLPEQLRSLEIRRMRRPDALAILPPDEDSAARREELIAALDGQSLDEHRLSAAVATHEIVGVRAIDDLQLQVRLAGPVSYFFHLLSYYPFMPVPRHVLERLEREGISTDRWTRPEHIVSNGPYVLKRWRFRQTMEFERNPHYWNVGAVRTERVRLSMIESYNTALNMYKAGEIDWPGSSTSIPAEFIDHLRDRRDFQIDPYLGVYFYWINTTRPPMDNVLVRKALSLAIDREQLCKYVTRAGQIPTADLVPHGLAGYVGGGRPLFDPDEARRLLAEAGYPGGQGLPPITLTYNTSESHRQIAVAVQQMWRQHLGIPVELVNQEWGVYLKTITETDFQMARMGWIGDYPDPNTFVELLASQNGNNHSNWGSAEFDQMLARANAATDPARRLELLAEAERMGMDAQPLIPIYIYTKPQLVKPYLRGLWSNYQDHHFWQYMWIDERWYDGIPDEPLAERPVDVQLAL